MTYYIIRIRSPGRPNDFECAQGKAQAEIEEKKHFTT